jgi:hypothetical protein
MTVQILVLLALALAGLLILWPVQRAISGGMTAIRDDLISRAEALIGRKIRYSSISPSIFGAFDVRDVRIMGDGESPLLSVSRFRISYSLLGLFWGRPQSIRSIRIDAPVIDFDTARDRDIIDTLRSFEPGLANGKPGKADGKADGRADKSRRGLAALFPERAMVRIRDGRCLIRHDWNQYQIQGLNLNARLIDDRIAVDGRWDIGILLDRLVGEPVRLRIGMRIDGSCGADLAAGSAVITIPAIAGELVRTRSIAFGAELSDKVLSLRKLPDQLPFNVSVDYGFGSGAVAARFDCASFRLRDILEFSGPWQGANQWLDIAGSGAASFDRGGEGTLGYRIDLAGAAPAGTGGARGANAAFEIRAGGDEQRAVVEAFRFSMPRTDNADGLFFGELSLRGDIGLAPLAPRGVLVISHAGFAGTETVNAEFTISTRGTEIGVFSRAVTLGQTKLAAVSASLLPAGADCGFTVSARRFQDADDDSRPGSFSLEGSINSQARRIEAGFALDSFSAADLSDMFRPFTAKPPLPDLLRGVWRNTVITTEVFFTTDFEHLLYNAPRLIVAYRGGGGITGTAALSGTDQRFELRDGRLTRGDEALLVSARAELSGQRGVTFSVIADYRDLSYNVEGLVNGRSMDVQGSYGFRLRLIPAYAGSYTGFVTAQDVPIPWRGRNMLVNCSASLRYDARSRWSVVVDTVDLSGIAGPAGLAQLRLSGRAGQDGASFPLLRYSDAIGPLDGSADFSWAGDFSRFDGKLVMEGGPERYNAEASFADRRLGISVTAARARLDRVIDHIDSAVVDGGLRLSWDSVNDFRAECTVASLSAKIQDLNFQGSARASLDERAFTVEDLRFNLAGLEGTVPLSRIQAAEGIAGTTAAIGGFAGGKRIDGAVSVDIRFKPVESWLEIGGALDSFNGRAHVENLQYAGAGSPRTFDVVFSRDNGEILISGGPQDMLRLQMDGNGNFYAGLSSPFPVRGSVTGSVNANAINARCNDLYIDMAELWNLVPFPRAPDIAFTGGYVNASVDIRGSLTDPEFFGSARGSSLRIQVPRYVTTDIRPVPFTVAIEGNEMRFGPIPASVGRGAGMVSAWFRFDRWIPNIFSIDITVPRETPIPFGLDITGFLARGDAAGRLTLLMENMVLDVSGDLSANNTEISLNADEMTRVQSMDGGVFADAVIPVTVDLNVSTGPVVEFLWPPDIPVLRATPDMGTRVRVTADSQTGRFSITSDIKIRSGEIFYFERSFYIRSGTLTFRENEMRFEPRLTARAEVRDRTEDGPVTISMLVDNAPLLSFNARFEANPSLSQMEIFALLGQNLTGTQVDENTGSLQRAFLSSTVDLFAQFAVVRQLERQIRNFMRLDMFSVRTQVLQNAAFNIMGLQQNPVDRTTGVSNYFDNTTIFGGKYVGQDMFVQGMFSMRYDANQTALGGLRLGDLRIEPDIGLELQNPLFTVRWDFVPTHWENWFVNDNSITLSKSWLF